MFPIVPFTTPASPEAPYRPPTQMDVQRHRLDATRARYLQLDVTARNERQNPLVAPLRALRVSVANLLIAAGGYLRQQPVAESTERVG